MEKDIKKFAPLFEEILTGLQGVLGKKLQGLYLYGSMVSGGFIDGTSDMDLFALLSAELSNDEFKALDKVHTDFIDVHPEWENGVEIAYFSEGGLASFREKRSPIAVISPGEPFNIHDAGEDWAINFYLLRDQGWVLYGKSPEDAFPKTTKEEFIEDVRFQALQWESWVEKTRELLRYQSYVVLTLSRALYVFRMGEQVSKQLAAKWMSSEFPEWTQLIEWAENLRVVEKAEGDPDESYGQVEKFVRFVIKEMTI